MNGELALRVYAASRCWPARRRRDPRSVIPSLRSRVMPETDPAAPRPPRDIRLSFQVEWDPGIGDPGRRGLLAPDQRVRTLLRVLVSYREVRYVVPDRVSLDGSADGRLLETIARFLERQTWLVKAVAVR